MTTHAISTDSELLLLGSKASKYAFYGVLIAGCSVVIATLLSSYVMVGRISFDGIISSQKSNIALWILDTLPFIFAVWGQYASVKMTREARTLVDNKTQNLRQALSEAEFTSQAKSDFFAKLSHEFRTPINGIIGMTDLLLESGLTKKQNRHADIIKSSAAGLLNLINDILDYSKIEAGKLELEEIDFDFHECVEAAVALLMRQAHKKGIELTALIHPDMPRRLIGDPGRLRQIIINLLGNAVKFTDTGEVTISVKKSREDRNGNIQIRVDVSDTGIGISSKQQATLFETYSQADPSIKRKYGGTGLGLSITKELVAVMGGKIGVVSKENHGSTFWFTVNMHKSFSHETTSSSNEISLKGLHVLVADEKMQTRSIPIDQLKVLGMVVEEAGDGSSALEKIIAAAELHRPFDLILTDMFLPGMSGEELGIAIKSRDDTKRTVLAMMTAVGVRGDAQRLNQIGFAGYFGKPLPAKDLQELLVAVMATQKQNESERQRLGLVTRYTLAEKRRRNNRILLADDSAVNREILLNMLSKFGLITDVALNGREALDAAQRTNYSAILLDLRMPELDGIEVLQSIRALPDGRKAVPVIILTAGASDDEIRHCRNVGADEILIKPVEASLLENILTRWLTLQPNLAANTSQCSDNVAQDDLQLIKIFIQEADKRLEALRHALAGSDMVSAAREAHTLKSTSAYINNTDMALTAAQIEQSADTGNLEQAQSTMVKLEKAYAKIRPELTHKLANQR